MKKNNEFAVKREEETKERRKNEMNAHEVKIALAKQARNLLVETKKNSGKKVVMKMETIQLLGKLEISEYPKNKDEIDSIITMLDNMIKNEEQLNKETV